MKLSFKTKFAYGLAGVGDSTLYNLAGTFLLFFLSTIVGIAPGIAGTIAAIGSVWETICGAVVGYVSDNTKTRFGKRKPFMLIAAFPLAIAISLFFTTIDASEGVRIVYYTVMILFFWTGFSTFFVPYLAWGAELTQDYDERTVLRGYTFVFNSLGMALGMVVPTIIVDFLMNLGKSSAQSWQYTGIFCGFCAALTIFFSALGVKDKYELAYREKKARGLLVKEEKKERSIKTVLFAIADMLRNYREIIKLRSIKYIVAASVFYLIGYAIFCADRMYYFTYNMNLSAGEISFLMMVMTFASVAFVPLILAANKKLDKRTLFILGMSICAVLMVFLGLIGVHSMWMASIFALAYCVGSICYWQLVPAMIYDVCEVDELANQKQRAGLVISIQSLAESLANAAGLQILGAILQFAGFQGEAASQPAHTLFWTDLSFSFIPAAFMLASIVMMVRYPVTKKMYNKVLSALTQRDQGEEIDMEEFKRLI